MDPVSDGEEPEKRGDEPRPAADTVVRPPAASPAEGTVVRPPAGGGAEGTVVRPPAASPAEGTVVRPPAGGGAEGTVVRPPTSAAGDDHGAVRFGPGPPAPGASAPAVPGWTAAGGPATRAGRGRGRVVGAGALVTALIVAGVLLYLHRHPSEPLQVTTATVAPSVAPGRSCDTTVDIVGTVHTNGRGGQITYRWLRSDGEQTDTLTQTVEDGATDVAVHLQWKVSGKGRYPATATLQVVEPDPIEGKGGFVYDCR